MARLALVFTVILVLATPTFADPPPRAKTMELMGHKLGACMTPIFPDSYARLYNEKGTSDEFGERKEYGPYYPAKGGEDKYGEAVVILLFKKDTENAIERIYVKDAGGKWLEFGSITEAIDAGFESPCSAIIAHYRSDA